VSHAIVPFQRAEAEAPSSVVEATLSRAELPRANALDLETYRKAGSLAGRLDQLLQFPYLFLTGDRTREQLKGYRSGLSEHASLAKKAGWFRGSIEWFRGSTDSLAIRDSNLMKKQESGITELEKILSEVAACETFSCLVNGELFKFNQEDFQSIAPVSDRTHDRGYLERPVLLELFNFVERGNKKLNEESLTALFTEERWLIGRLQFCYSRTFADFFDRIRGMVPKISYEITCRDLLKDIQWMIRQKLLPTEFEHYQLFLAQDLASGRQGSVEGRELLWQYIDTRQSDINAIVRGKQCRHPITHEYTTYPSCAAKFEAMWKQAETAIDEWKERFPGVKLPDELKLGSITDSTSPVRSLRECRARLEKDLSDVFVLPIKVRIHETACDFDRDHLLALKAFDPVLYSGHFATLTATGECALEDKEIVSVLSRLHPDRCRDRKRDALQEALDRVYLLFNALKDQRHEAAPVPKG
jgi:hypothetical protein